jgi:arylsulfatase A-like enzyme
VEKKDKLPRREFITALGKGIGALSVLPLLSSGGIQAAEELQKLNAIGGDGRKRNVIFILSDDHRYDAMGFMGKYEFLETPNMDKLARGGAHLENAFVSTSLCSPSRASILTGMYAHKHGVVDNMSPVKEDLIYFPQYLRQMGYETAFIGKWHMGETQGDDSPRKGFDKWISFKGQGEYFDPELNIDGKRIKKKGYITEILTDYAIEWMNRERDKPFFLYLSHKAVHAMFKPAKRYLGKYENIKVPYPASMSDTPENYEGKPAWVKEQRNSWHGVDYMYYGELDFDSFFKRYFETLLSLDDSIGKIIEFTEDKGIAGNTVVMYMGDNGFLFGEHGLIDKRNMYEESIRVPLLAYCPGYIKPGTKIKQLVQNIDIAATILHIAGGEKPDYMDGESFLPLLRNEKIPWRDEIYYEYYWERAFPQTPSTFGVRSGKYKYIYYHGVWDVEEIYDIEKDPLEMHNIIKENPELAREMADKMFTWLEETGGMKIPVKRIPDFIRDAHGPVKKG